MEVTLIGMGPGDPSALTGGALAALEQADVLIGSRRLVERCALSPDFFHKIGRDCGNSGQRSVGVPLRAVQRGYRVSFRDPDSAPLAGGAWDQLEGAPRCVQYAVFCRHAGPSLAGVAGGIRPRPGL